MLVGIRDGCVLVCLYCPTAEITVTFIRLTPLSIHYNGIYGGALVFKLFSTHRTVNAVSRIYEGNS